jgi:FixJ family two-component response regulator
VIFITAFDEPEARALAAKAGAAAFLAKPFSGRVLVDTIQRAAAA